MGHAWTMPCHGLYPAAHGVLGKAAGRGDGEEPLPAAAALLLGAPLPLPRPRPRRRLRLPLEPPWLGPAGA